MYQPRSTPVSHDVSVRGLQYRIHCWGDETGTPVYLLHGWADVGMSFQFLADQMADDWYLIAPDWRGFGDSQWSRDGYWFPDYLADLEIVIQKFTPGQKVRLVGHSMGGNVAWLYAGIRPEQVSHAVSLDVYGMPDSDPANAPSHYARWLDQLNTGLSFSRYADIQGVIDRIQSLAPMLGHGEAQFLAGHWSVEDKTEGYRLKHDPAHKRVNPVLYRRSEAISCWQNIKAKVLLIMAARSALYENYIKEGYQTEIRDTVRHLKEVVIDDSGHMVHLEQPAKLAEVLNGFLSE